MRGPRLLLEKMHAVITSLLTTPQFAASRPDGLILLEEFAGPKLSR